jgi:hypothetical protein
MNEERLAKLALGAGSAMVMLFLLSLTWSPKGLFVAQSYQSLVR